MAWVALCGPELEENLSLRYLAATLKASGIDAHVLAASQPEDFPAVLARILRAPEPPLAVGLSLAFQWRAPEFLALAVALREEGYGGHITAGGHFATFAAAELLRDFPALDSICRQEAEETQDDTDTFLVDVDLGCGAATTTKHYRVNYLMTGHPAIEELPGV
jgi:anaerobic magnesium-protoporphyrin IX monomethyl ester cyclase